jgi:type I restriction enzyme S subunit
VVKSTLFHLTGAENKSEALAYWRQAEAHFNALFDHPVTVAELRAAILQLAVHGRLVPQHPDDEPASDLLRQIESEKQRLYKAGEIKKPKKLPPIAPDEIPYELPVGWAWVRLSEFGEFTGGGTPSKRNPDFWDGDIPWISPKDMKSDYVDSSEMKITEQGVEGSSAKMIPAGSLLIVARSGILKRLLPVAINTVDCTVNQDIKVLVPYLSSTIEYLRLLLKGHESFILEQLVKTGTTVQSLRYDEFALQPFPVPPFAE